LWVTNVSWNALKWLELTIDVISMPLKDMGLKDGPFKPILKFEFHCLNACLVALKICFHCDSNPKSFEVPKSGLQTPSKMKMLPIFVM
jgi:hypothetical protein